LVCLAVIASLLIMGACKEDGPFTMIKSSNSILINGSVDNLTLPGGIAGGAGAIPSFNVTTDGTDMVSVNVTNRYTLQGATALNTKLLGNFPLSGGKVTIPAILISTLRNAPDAAITATTNMGTNTLLIDAVLSSGAQERRIVPVTLANTVVLLDNDVFKINIAATTSAGVPSYLVTVNTTGIGVRVTSRYVLPGQSTAKNYTGGAVIYPTTAVDAVTRTVTVPAMGVAQMRDPADPAITGLGNVGQQFILIEALSTSTPAGTVLASKTANVVW